MSSAEMDAEYWVTFDRGSLQKNSNAKDLQTAVRLDIEMLSRLSDGVIVSERTGIDTIPGESHILGHT